MSSTRNKNMPGDYALEQNSIKVGYKYYTYDSFGKPVETHYAGDGLLPGRIAPTNLAFNACDIESQLFGIGSTNLVRAKGHVIPEIRPVESLSIMQRMPIILPDPLTVLQNQRPYPMR